MENGLDLTLLIQQATANPIAAFGWLDVVISALVVLILAGRRILASGRRMRFVVAGTCTAGVSLALPMYLHFIDDKKPA